MWAGRAGRSVPADTPATARGILMSDAMAQACAEYRKTQTRRVVLPQPPPEHGRIDECRWRCPYGQAGDLLYVRECWAMESNRDDHYEAPEHPFGPVRWHNDPESGWFFECPRYRAAEPDMILGDDEDGMRWRPSIYMPRWAARTWLRITGVRVERVQAISEADANAEGFTHREHFIRTWDTLNAKRGYGFDANPWVFRLSFERTDAPNV